MNRRLWIANMAAALVVAALLGALFNAVFGALATHTDWSRAWEYRGMLWQGWLTTLSIASAALVCGMIIGLLFMLGQRSNLVVLRWCCRGILEFLRDTPLLVHLLFGYFVILAPLLARPLGAAGWNDKPIIGVLILSLFHGAYLGEILRGAVESIPRAQWDSARAVGFDRIQVYRHVIIPRRSAACFPPSPDRSSHSSRTRRCST